MISQTCREHCCGAGTVAHLGSLVLEPDLHHPHGQARLSCQSLPHLSTKRREGEQNQKLIALKRVQACNRVAAPSYLPARLGGNLEGGLEGPPLLRGEDGARALGALVVFALLAALAVRVAAIFILAFHCKGRSGAVAQQRAAFPGRLPGQGFRETVSFAPHEDKFGPEAQNEARRARGLSCGSGEHGQ